MKIKFQPALAILGLVLFSFPLTAHALIVNGGFESGDFTGWNTIGNAIVTDSSFGSGPVEGAKQAFISNSPGSVSSNSVETFLGLPTNSLDAVQGKITLEGSAVKQIFSGNAGDILSLDVNFLTNEAPNDPQFNDFAFVTVGPFTKLADTFSVFVPSTTAFQRETGFFKFSYTLPANGNYTLGVGVVDVSDRFGDSGLLIDNVALISTAPEPGTLLLFALGLIGISFLKKSPI